MTLAENLRDLVNRLRQADNDLDAKSVPPGGTTGQALTKASNADRDTAWSDITAGLTEYADTAELDAVLTTDLGYVTVADLGSYIGVGDYVGMPARLLVETRVEGTVGDEFVTQRFAVSYFGNDIPRTYTRARNFNNTAWLPWVLNPWIGTLPTASSIPRYESDGEISLLDVMGAGNVYRDSAVVDRGSLEFAAPFNAPGIAERGMLIPNPNAAPTLLGLAAPTVTGTQTNAVANRAAATVGHKYNRIDYVAAAAATNAVAAARFPLGLIPAQDRLMLRARWIIAAGQSSSSRMFVGLAPSGASVADAQPSALTNCVGIAFDLADANVSLMHNDGSGTATKTALSPVVPVNDTPGAILYDLVLYLSSGILWFADLRVHSGSTVTRHTASAASNVPTSSGALDFFMKVSAGGVSAQPAIGLLGLEYGLRYGISPF